MPEIDFTELQEIVFDAPAAQPALLVNPDPFVKRLLALPRGPMIPPPARNRFRDTRWKKPLICLECVVGRHDQCTESACPCVHRDIASEKLQMQVEGCCWPV